MKTVTFTDEEYEQLRSILARVRTTLDAPDKPDAPDESWRDAGMPRVGSSYRHLSADGFLRPGLAWLHDPADRALFIRDRIGTDDELADRDARDKARHTIRQWAKAFDPFEVDWSDGNQKKYVISSIQEDGTPSIWTNHMFRPLDPPAVFSTHGKAKACFEACKQEWLTLMGVSK